ncbi:MAG: 4Fe-4S dicluster domain-containing protein [Mycobacterium sp.]|nr:MAG: 4Fe-4S dicluster domain-containing protein [Mycobacterium sp.]
MPHVITQSCCGDGSCVYACPVNCIHPSPDEPGFGTAEMLHIDPVACVDCGACVTACPVGAIVADTRLTPGQLPFIDINAAYYPPRPAGERVPPTTTLAPVLPAPRLERGGLRVAVVGSGPAGMYAADELLTQARVRVNVFDALPTPYGLVRAGVAPDHPQTKAITRLFDRMSRRDGFRFCLNVEVGRHVSHDELLEHHHAVLYAVGAAHERRLDIEGLDADGTDLPGTGSATEFVAWINGHPRFAGRPVDLDHPAAVVIGNGNVALDVARILTADPEQLATTDIADAALAALRASAIREVVVAARRGPADSAFTLPELVGLTTGSHVVLDEADRTLVRRDLRTADDPVVRAKLEVLAALPGADADAGTEPRRRRIRLAYRLTPARVLGDGRARGVEFTRTGGDEIVRLDAGLVLTAIGYRGRPVAGLPFDDAAAVVPNVGGRVIDPSTGRPVTGAYVAGWIKRGPTGFIGTNKSCAMDTVAALVDDFNDGRLADPIRRSASLDTLIRSRQPDLVDAAGWRAIDEAEQSRGAEAGRPRVKFTTVPDLIAAARPGRSARRGGGHIDRIASWISS